MSVSDTSKISYDTFAFKNKTYTMYERMTFGEVTNVRRLIKQLVASARTVESPEAFLKLPTNEQLQLIESSDVINEEYSQLMANVLYRCLNLSQEDLNKIEFLDAVEMFGMVYRLSTEVKKKSSQQ